MRAAGLTPARRTSSSRAGFSAKAAWIGQRLDELVKTVGKEPAGAGFELPQARRQLFCRDRPLAEIHGTGHVNAETLQKLAGCCAEFLVHAVDVEGLCRGIDRELVEKLGDWTPFRRLTRAAQIRWRIWKKSRSWGRARLT